MRNNFLRQIPFSFITIVSLFLFTNAYAITDSKLTLDKFLNSSKAFSADFTQNVYDDNQRLIQHLAGKMLLKRPGQFYWQTEKPFAQILVVNHGKLWLYDPDLAQVTIRKLTDSETQTPAFLLSHTPKQLTQLFNVKLLSSSKNAIQIFQLLPKKAESLFSSIKLNFHQAKLAQLIVYDHIGHSTVIDFSHLNSSPKINSQSFELHFPINVDVIDEANIAST